MFEESVSSIPSIWASMNSWFTPAVFFVLLNVMIGTIAFTSTLANQKQQQQRHQDSPNGLQHQPPKLASSPSVLQRLKSINFSTFRSQEAHSLNLHLDSETHFNFEATQNILSHHNQEKHGHHLFEQNPSESAKGNEESFVYLETHSQQSPQEEKLEENADWQLENAGSGEEIQSLDEVYSKLNGQQVSRSKSDTKPVAGEVPMKLPGKMKKSATMKSAFKHFEVEDIVEARRPVTVKERSSKADVVDEEVDAKADDFINKFKQQLQLQRLDSIVRYKEMIGRGNGR